MTDAAIVRWLATEVMGWQFVQKYDGGVCEFQDEHGARLFTDAAKWSNDHVRWWPLSKAGSADELLEVLRQKGYRILIELDGPEWAAMVIHRNDGEPGHGKGASWMRAVCLASYRATGGPIEQSDPALARAEAGT